MKVSMNTTTASRNHPTRRKAMVGLATALGCLVARSRALGQSPPPPMKEAPSAPASHSRTSLHQEIAFDASPARIYEVLLDSQQFAAFTGMSAKIDPRAGGAFTTFG